MDKEQKEKLEQAINILSKFNGKQLNDDIPIQYCDAIWDLIGFAQVSIRTTNTLEREDCEHFQSSQDRQCLLKNILCEGNQCCNEFISKAPRGMFNS